MDQNNMPVTREEKMTVWDWRVALLEYLQENNLMKKVASDLKDNTEILA